MRLACACSGDEASEYNFAVIDLPSDYVAWLQNRIAVARALQDGESAFLAIEYSDYQATYYASLAPFWPEPAGGDFLPVPDNFLSAAMSQKVTASSVRINPARVAWLAYPKHGGGQVETACMSTTALQNLALARTAIPS